MKQFIGLDVSLKDTFVSVREGGKRIWRGKCPSDPKLVAEVNRPTHRVYAVRKIGNDKSFWTVIGAAWANRDGKGFNVKLDLLPLTGAEIVIREPRDEDERG